MELRYLEDRYLFNNFKLEGKEFVSNNTEKDENDYLFIRIWKVEEERQPCLKVCSVMCWADELAAAASVHLKYLTLGTYRKNENTLVGYVKQFMSNISRAESRKKQHKNDCTLLVLTARYRFFRKALRKSFGITF